MAKVVNAINDSLGEHSIMFASTVGKEKDHEVVSLAWRSSGVRKSDA